MRILKKYESFINNSSEVSNDFSLTEDHSPIDTPEISDDVNAIVADVKQMQNNPSFRDNDRLSSMMSEIEGIDLEDASSVQSFCDEHGINCDIYKGVLNKLKVTESFIFEDVINESNEVLLAAIAALIMSPEAYGAATSAIKTATSKIIGEDESEESDENLEGE